jgi:hypothetical protein
VRNPAASYDWIYLQDRPADEYRRYGPSTEREAVLS